MQVDYVKAPDRATEERLVQMMNAQAEDTRNRVAA